jgi:phage terminase small subunit
MELTEKQKRFADAYIETGNASEAARRAGYSEKTARFTASENLTKPNIKSYIDERLQQLSDQRIMKAEEVMQILTSIARNEEQEEVVVFGEGSSSIVNKGMSAKDRIKALELIGKRYAIFTDKKQVEGTIGVTIIDDLDDDDEC